MKQGETRRAAIVEATIQVVGEKGYPATAVADVIAAAGASRTTFYKHFADKRECFLEAYDLAVERILAAAESGCEEPGTWSNRVRAGLAAVVDLLAAKPALGRTAIVEVASAGADARRRHAAAMARLAELLEAGRNGDGPALPRNTALMAIGAVAGLVLDELREDRAANLPRMQPELEFALLVPFLGPKMAAPTA
jgi:AcrR family transcriptional regulator